MNEDSETRLAGAIDRIVASTSPRKLIVAGPGTGKTWLFKTLLTNTDGDVDERLVLTFINNLRADLAASLGELARVYTVHGFCQSLLYRHSTLRAGLTADFRCQPRLATVIKSDWQHLIGGNPPQFVEMMRRLADPEAEELRFYTRRANYYDAVDFDDSVYRTHHSLRTADAALASYALVLIDEFQDFNELEAGIIELLAERSPITIAGDDDQALYSQLRGASWEIIRRLHAGDEYEVFELPFCMRCPAVVVEAVNDVISRARESGRLEGRIDKPYEHYEPVKGEDSRRYPHITLVRTTVQRLNANYWGRYIASAIDAIPVEEVVESAGSGDPTALIIGSIHYLRQVAAFLEEQGYEIETKKDTEDPLDRAVGLRILRDDASSNLGWRIVLESEDAELAGRTVREADERSDRLVDALGEGFKSAVLGEAEALPSSEEPRETAAGGNEQRDPAKPRIKLTSFEGAKGLSAYHVFIVGMHEGDIPRDPKAIDDLEICRFLVALTRTRKSCTLLCTGRFASRRMRPSPFLDWIDPARYEILRINAQYWRDR